MYSKINCVRFRLKIRKPEFERKTRFYILLYSFFKTAEFMYFKGILLVLQGYFCKLHNFKYLCNKNKNTFNLILKYEKIKA